MEDTPAGLKTTLSAREIGIRSYVVRSGRMTDMQKDALERLYPRFGIPWNPDEKINAEILFKRTGPFVVEIGFGMGLATADIAQALPDTSFLGIEVHAPGVGKLLSEIESRQIENLRICRHDAVEIVDSMIEAGSVDGFHVFFPDPWPKKRHHKRRIMNPDFVRLLTSRLRLGGYIYFVTDWEEYAEATLEVLMSEPGLSNAYAPWAKREDWRPVTKFEQRALNEGRLIRELKFVKN
ncbi:MAG: tRNA (guanosine(46)-N7)-methyltransferase TrmB [Spirochaetales bacterium]|nr:tRNA (guanosine(46)-N7)-methyltransferase TrmB [Spirochaetales bacterium]